MKISMMLNLKQSKQAVHPHTLREVVTEEPRLLSIPYKPNLPYRVFFRPAVSAFNCLPYCRKRS